jgi:formate dehydrogenase
MSCLISSASKRCWNSARVAPAGVRRVLRARTNRNGFHATSRQCDKVLCVLYPDPSSGYPPEYARDSCIPKITKYPDGQLTPTPKSIDFTPGQLLGCVSGELGLRKFLESQGHELVVTADKDGEGCEFDEHLKDAHYVISQPFYPAYLTKKRLDTATNLKAAITAGVGSDHVDLEAAMANKVDVCEVTYCNSISVSEHVVMMILALVRNYIPSHQVVVNGGWNVADCAQRAYDIEGMKVGTVAAGRIGLAVLKRLHPFDCELHYCDRHRLPKEIEDKYNLQYWSHWEHMVQAMDVVTLNCPLHSETEYMVNSNTIKLFKKGAYLVNTARGKLCDETAIEHALEQGDLAGYAGDVWFPQPPPTDHPWRHMPWHAMTPHTSGTTLSAQTRYAAGTREILEDYFEGGGKQIREEYQIVRDGKLAGAGAHSYSKGNATKGSEEAVGVEKHVDQGATVISL